MATNPFDDASIPFDAALSFNGSTPDAIITSAASSAASTAADATSVSSSVDVVAGPAVATSTAGDVVSVTGSNVVSAPAASATSIAATASLSTSVSTVVTFASATSAAVAPTQVLGEWSAIVSSPEAAVTAATALVPPTITSSIETNTAFDADISFDGDTSFNGSTDPSILAEPAAATSVAPSADALAITGTLANSSVATAVAPSPTVNSDADPIFADSAAAASVTPQPSSSSESNSTIAPPAAGATALGLVPSSISGGGNIAPDPAIATALAAQPSVADQANVVITVTTSASSAAVALDATMLNNVSITAASAAASATAGAVSAASFIDAGSTLQQVWTALVMNPDGSEFIINPIGDVSVTETFDLVTATIEIPWHASGLPSVTDLVSDIVLLRGKTKMYRLRVLDSEDVLTRETHLVRLTCCSYEEILRVGRIIYADAEMTGDQLTLAWNIVQLAQDRQPLGITRYVPTPAGTSKTIQVRAGTTTAEAIDTFAAEDDGFDWWIDADLAFHTQEPRRESIIDFEWTWGAEIAEMAKSSSVEQYLSATYVSGATSEVTIPGGATYPPPAPAVREVDDMPYGRWEKAFAYSNIVTNASLVKRADWHLGVGSRLRPTYTIVLEQGVWSPSIKIGGIVAIRAQANERLSFKVPARIEEMTIQTSVDGAEIVSMLLRAESEEINIGSGVPAEVLATNTPPVGSTVVAVPDPAGLSKTLTRISPVDGLATVITSLADRISRQERT